MIYRSVKQKFFVNQRGQIALTIVLALLGVTAILVTALTALTVGQLRKLNNIIRSAQSYYVSESGIEDALLRISRRMNYASSYTLNVSSGFAQVEITGTTNQPIVTSRGNQDNRVRKLQTTLQSTQNSTNISFNYGVQVGYGGLEMENNAGINGNVYSNGPIEGENGAFITGTAYSANSPAQGADQINDTPSTPPNSIEFARTNANQDAAQSFQVSQTNLLSRVDLYLRKVSTPGNINVRITGNSGGNPSSTTLASTTLNASLVGTTYSWVTVNFSSPVQLNSGVTYWLVLDTSANSSRYYQWGANTGYANGDAKTGQYSAGPWTATGLDGYFKVYLGGAQGLIDNVDIGSGGVGDAHAHTINNSTIAGNNYCQTGSGNNKPCNTSQPDPGPENFAISQANIDQWKTEAEAGGVISGDYTLINGATATLGPKKITGNMIIDNNVVLTISGTLWVQGYVSLSNNVIIKLDPGYGTSGGVIVADGYVNIFNNATFQNSGQPGSYILIISTNDCNGLGSPTGQVCTTDNSAINVGNNAGTAIVYGQNGQVKVSNNAGAKEITGYKLKLDNNATVTYETGLANVNFSSGPGGGYTIMSWQEVI